MWFTSFKEHQHPFRSTWFLYILSGSITSCQVKLSYLHPFRIHYILLDKCWVHSWLHPLVLLHVSMLWPTPPMPTMTNRMRPFKAYFQHGMLCDNAAQHCHVWLLLSFWVWSWVVTSCVCTQVIYLLPGSITSCQLHANVNLHPLG